MPNWPISLNTITEGAIIKASDLELNFTKLKNATNTLHERFSTLSFGCSLSKEKAAYVNSGGSDAVVYHIISDFTAPNATTDNDDIANCNRKRVIGLFNLPSWAQAIRLRRLDVLNHTVIDVDNVKTAVDAFVGADNFPVEFGIAYATSLSGLEQTSGGTMGTPVSGTVAFNASSGSSPGAQFYAGYSWADLSSGSGIYPVSKGVDLNTLVLGGQYVAIWARGGYKYTVDGTTTLKASSYQYSVNLLCDAMVPIP